MQIVLRVAKLLLPHKFAIKTFLLIVIALYILTKFPKVWIISVKYFLIFKNLNFRNYEFSEIIFGNYFPCKAHPVDN